GKVLPGTVEERPPQLAVRGGPFQWLHLMSEIVEDIVIICSQLALSRQGIIEAQIAGSGGSRRDVTHRHSIERKRTASGIEGSGTTQHEFTSSSNELLKHRLHGSIYLKSIRQHQRSIVGKRGSSGIENIKLYAALKKELCRTLDIITVARDALTAKGLEL